jgi:hypothetical protein
MTLPFVSLQTSASIRKLSIIHAELSKIECNDDDDKQESKLELVRKLCKDHKILWITAEEILEYKFDRRGVDDPTYVRSITVYDDFEHMFEWTACQVLSAMGKEQRMNPKTTQTLEMAKEVCIEFVLKLCYCEAHGKETPCVKFNGKEIRYWPGLRREMQDFIYAQFAGESDAGDSKEHRESPEQVVGRLLTMPVTEVVTSEEDANTPAARVAKCLLLKESLIQPLTVFCKTKLHLPFMLHDVPAFVLQESVKVAAQLPASEKTPLKSVLKMIVDHMNLNGWQDKCRFVADVISVYRDIGSFPDASSEEVGLPPSKACKRPLQNDWQVFTSHLEDL